MFSGMNAVFWKMNYPFKLHIKALDLKPYLNIKMHVCHKYNLPKNTYECNKHYRKYNVLEYTFIMKLADEFKIFTAMQHNALKIVLRNKHFNPYSIIKWLQ